MIDINLSTIIQAVNFLVLLWILNLVLYRPIRRIIIERKEKTTGLKNSFDTLSNKLVSQTESYKNGIKDARAKGLKEKSSLIEEASKEEKQIINKINEKAKANLIEIRQKISSDTQEARKELEKEIDSYASLIGEKILGRAC